MTPTITFTTDPMQRCAAGCRGNRSRCQRCVAYRERGRFSSFLKRMFPKPGSAIPVLRGPSSRLPASVRTGRRSGRSCPQVSPPHWRRDLSYGGREAPLPVNTLATSASGCAPPTERRETPGTLSNVSQRFCPRPPGLMSASPTKSPRLVLVGEFRQLGLRLLIVCV